MSTFEKNINSIKVDWEYLNNHLPENRAEIMKCLADKYYVIPKVAFHGDSKYQLELNKHNYTYDDYEEYLMRYRELTNEIRIAKQSIEDIDKLFDTNTSFAEYLESFQILVDDGNGNEKNKKRETMVSFNDSQNLIKARKDILLFAIEKLNKQIEELKEKNKDLIKEFESEG